MTGIDALIIIVGVILLCGLLYYEKKRDKKPLLIVKSVLSALFVVTALLQPSSAPTYYHYLLVGLVFCLIGDVCLALPQEKAFRTGLVAFLMGHVFYIFSFASLVHISRWGSIALFAVVCVSVFVFLWLRPYLKSMLIPVLIYIVVITVMVIGAWAAFAKSFSQTSGKTLILAGALCFYFSDVFVARDRFVNEGYRNRLFGLPLYYVGQFMLAFSVGLL